MLSTKKLIQFLRAAKLATYAGQGDDASVIPALLDSKQLEYRDGEFFYRDIYVGMFAFVGQEIVYQSDRAIWSMSYAGALDESVPQDSARGIYSLLRQALRNVPSELPLRGPNSLEADGMRYTCHCDGSIERFHGVEIIAGEDHSLYQLYFSGGFLE